MMITGAKRIYRAGIKTALDLIGDSKAAKAKPEQFADMRFVKELDETGYIANL